MTEALAETVLQMGMTKLPAVTQLRGANFSVTHFIPSLRTSVMCFIRRKYMYDVAPF